MSQTSTINYTDLSLLLPNNTSEICFPGTKDYAWISGTCGVLLLAICLLEIASIICYPSKSRCNCIFIINAFIFANAIAQQINFVTVAISLLSFEQGLSDESSNIGVNASIAVAGYLSMQLMHALKMTLVWNYEMLITMTALPSEKPKADK